MPPFGRSRRTYSYSPEASDMAMIFMLSLMLSDLTNCTRRYRTAPSCLVTCSMRVPSCSSSGVKKICPRMTSAA